MNNSYYIPHYREGYKMFKRVIVTGGYGFIGSNFVNYLLENNLVEKVIVIDNFSSGYSINISDSVVSKSKVVFQAFDWDLAEQENKFQSSASLVERLTKLIDDNEVDAIFHFASLARNIPSILNPVLYYNNNIFSTINVLEAIRQSNSKPVIVNSSSSSVYGKEDCSISREDDEKNPQSPYALQKLINEQIFESYFKLYDVDSMSLRYFSVYGDRYVTDGQYSLVIGKFINQVLSGENMTLYKPGKQSRDFTYVQDVVLANIKAANYLINYHKKDLEYRKRMTYSESFILNIGTGTDTKIYDIALYMKALFNRDSISTEIEEIESGFTEPIKTLANNTKAKNILQWEPQFIKPFWWIEKEVKRRIKSL